MRRVERAILGSPMVLRSVTAVNVIGRRDNEMVQTWMTRFTPMLRYGNPALSCEFRPIKMVPHVAAAEAASPPAAEAAASADQAAAEAVPTEGTGSVEATDTGTDTQERIELQFTDGTSHVMNLSLYRWSHQIMQRIVELDTEKGLSAA
mmetsp:Transcript_15256/g.34436  ORF Transcript_15256/g.34436 Transcript_15256/m.34436 type:complete len:149 (-) Transcript_15256:130-576(-)